MRMVDEQFQDGPPAWVHLVFVLLTSGAVLTGCSDARRAGGWQFDGRGEVRGVDAENLPEPTSDTYSESDTSPSDTGDVDGWNAEACNPPKPSTVDLHSSTAGNWKLALSPPSGKYMQLSISDAAPLQAAAVYDDGAGSVAGATLSTKARSKQNAPADLIVGTIPNHVESVATIDRALPGGEFETNDDWKAARVEYDLTVSAGTTVRRLRDDILFELAPFDRSEVGGLPNSSGTQHTKFRVEITVIQRDRADAPTRNLYLMALAPLETYRDVERVQFRIDDLTNTTNIAEKDADLRPECSTDTLEDHRPVVDVLFVVDQDGLSDYRRTILKFVGELLMTADGTLHYRIGVTNMQLANGGTPVNAPTWEMSKSDVATALDRAAFRCESGPNWSCDESEPHGLEVTRDFLRDVPAADVSADNPGPFGSGRVVPILVTDDEDAASVVGGASKDEYVNFFSKYGTLAALTPGSGCPGGTKGDTYVDVVRAVGGESADLCDGDWTELARRIVLEQSRSVEPLVLSDRPISTSLQIEIDGRNVPRGGAPGYSYVAHRNSLRISGLIENATPPVRDRHLAVHYLIFDSP